MTVVEYGSEITWDVDGGATEGPYADSAATHPKELCLTPGSHTIHMYDSYGDGWHGGKLEIKAGGKILLDDGLVSGASSKTADIIVE